MLIEYVSDVAIDARRITAAVDFNALAAELERAGAGRFGVVFRADDGQVSGGFFVVRGAGASDCLAAMRTALIDQRSWHVTEEV